MLISEEKETEESYSMITHLHPSQTLSLQSTASCTGAVIAQPSSLNGLLSSRTGNVERNTFMIFMMKTMESNLGL